MVNITINSLKFLTFQESTNFSVEIEKKWKKCHENIPFKEGPTTANSALAVCDPQIFPAIHNAPYHSCNYNRRKCFL